MTFTSLLDALKAGWRVRGPLPYGYELVQNVNGVELKGEVNFRLGEQK